MEARFLIKNKIEQKLLEVFPTTNINGERFFLNKSGVPFRILTLDVENGALVIEYADTWEDGDLFFIDELSEEEIYKAMLAEIEG